MTSTGQPRILTFRTRGRLAGAGLAAIITVGLASVATQPAQGQAAPTATETTLYTFTGGTDGGSPYAGLTRDAEGNLYGVTFAGGSANLGTVYKIDTADNETVLHSFTGKPDGEHPSRQLLRDHAGNLFGVAYEGGANGYGGVFEVDAGGTESVLYSFGPGTDGEYPSSPLIGDEAGNLIGTTGYGGTTGNGTIYRLSKTGQETILHNFRGPEGANPFTALIRDSSGNLYGTASLGGASGNGTVFELTHNGHMTLLHSFSNGTDGANPYAGLTRDSVGNLYGTTYYGGAACHTFGCGTVFMIDTQGNETILHAFGESDGHYPDFGTLAMDASGNLYGTTYAGGTADMGVVFEVTSSGTESVLYNFTGGADEGFPVSGLVRDSSGNLYGTTLGNAPTTNGTVFKITP